jgi:hypothetical protein
VVRQHQWLYLQQQQLSLLQQCKQQSQRLQQQQQQYQVKMRVPAAAAPQGPQCSLAPAAAVGPLLLQQGCRLAP